MELNQNDLLDLISRYNKTIEKEVSLLNDKPENKTDSIIKMIELDYVVKKYNVPHFQHAYILYHKIKGTEVGMAVIVDSIDDKNLSILKSILGDKELFLYPIESCDELTKIKTEEETAYIIKDTRDIYRLNLVKYKIEEFNIPIFNIRKS